MTKYKSTMTKEEIDRLRAKLVAVGWGTMHVKGLVPFEWGREMMESLKLGGLTSLRLPAENLLPQARRWKKTADEIAEILAEMAIKRNRSKVKEPRKKSLDAQAIYEHRKKQTATDRHDL